MQAVASRRQDTPFVVAHRAGNRLDALADAERLGVSVVEADLRLFRRRVEVRHLKNIGPLPLFWDRWRLAAPWAPRLVLADLLRAMRPGTELMLDLKGRRTRLGQLVARAIEPLASERRFTVCARAPQLLEPFRALPVRRFHSVGSARQLAALLRHGPAECPDGVSVHARLLDARVVQELRHVTNVLVTWPVNRLEDAAELASLGVDGLITDVPALLLADRART